MNSRTIRTANEPPPALQRLPLYGAAALVSVLWLATVLASTGATEAGIAKRAPMIAGWLTAVDHYDRLPALILYYVENGWRLLLTGLLPVGILWAVVLRAAPCRRPQAAHIAVATSCLLAVLAATGAVGAGWYLAKRMEVWDVRYAEYRLELAKKLPIATKDRNGRAMTASYAARYEHLLNTPTAAGPDIIFVGDSITEPLPWAEYFPSLRVLNRGIGNDTINGVHSRLPEINRHRPKIVSLMIGLNDISPNAPDDDVDRMFARYRTLVEGFTANTVIIHPILPIRVQDERDRPVLGRSLKKISAFNRLLPGLCDGRRVLCATTAPAMIAADGELSPEMTVDGAHLSGKGFLIWIEHIRSMPMVQALIRLRTKEGN